MVSPGQFGSQAADLGNNCTCQPGSLLSGNQRMALFAGGGATEHDAGPLDIRGALDEV